MIKYFFSFFNKLTIQNNKKTLNFDRNFANIMRKILIPFFNLFFNIEVDDNIIKNLNPPYIILANHSNWWDPFLIGIFIKKPLHFIATEDIFRLFPYNFILPKLGAIPKIKFYPDFDTIKKIFEVKQNNGIIGIFPEGERNWDGNTLQIVPSTIKLLKKLSLPVVICLLKGAHMVYPRWAKTYRKGNILVHFTHLITKEEIDNLDEEALYNLINEKFSYNEYEFYRDKKALFLGKNKSKGLGNFLFICPHCKSINKNDSKGNFFYCRNCGYEVFINKYNFFELSKTSKVNTFYFDNPYEWNKWQISYISDQIKQNSINYFYKDKGIILFSRKKKGSLFKINSGTLKLDKNSLIVHTLRGKDIIFELKKIASINVLYRNILDFYYENSFYRIIFENSKISAYKYVITIKALKSIY
ncbi:MAG: 1-acyl-sn-glycerol-3-phosphate acyltransferase [Spirochaetes bacterium]|nr:1-acyl-sn-glycerol-3-phosphate acyltransferase [Spirochaetota bacterium]